jgi:hypothetical protein
MGRHFANNEKKANVKKVNKFVANGVLLWNVWLVPEYQEAYSFLGEKNLEMKSLYPNKISRW